MRSQTGTSTSRGLAALHHRLGDADATHTAATRARELNADAPVDPFLKGD